MQTSVAKKIFAVGVAVSTALAFAPFTAFAAAHAEGTNVKKSDGTVGMIIGGQFRPYTSAGAFLSYGFNSWSSVVDANADDLALPTGAFIPPQDGTVFCATETKGTDVKGECSLITGGQKAAFTSAAVFTGLGFSFSRAEYGDSSFLAKTTDINSSTEAHRPGVLVNNNGTVQLVGANSLMGIPDIATFNSWGYSFADVVPANAADKAMTQSGVMAARVAGQLSPTALASVPASSGSVSVALAADNPASGAVVASSAAVSLLKVNFTGSGTVNSVTLKRIGVSADTSLNNVYLYDGATRLTDGVSVTSGGNITFSNGSGLFTVNGSRTISVVADLTASAGETLGVQMTGYTVAGGTAATVALTGNLMSVANATLASVSFSSPLSSVAVNSSLDPQPDVVVWRSTATVGTRDVTLTRAMFHEVGSINYSDLANFRLYVDGTLVASASSLDSNGYVTFVPASPVTLKVGGRDIKVLADVNGGAYRDFTFSVKNASDLGLMDTQYNAGVIAGGDVLIAAGKQSISYGSVTVQKATDSPTANLTLAATNQLLAKYTLTTYGEPVKITDLTFTTTMATNASSVPALTNGYVTFNGVQYGATKSLSTGGSTTGGDTTFTVNYTTTPGTPVTVAVYGDVVSSDSSYSVHTGDKVKVTMKAATSNGQGTVSGQMVNVPNSISVDANEMTVAAGGLNGALTKTANYGNQSTVVPQTNYKLASFQLNGNSTEDVNINTISVDFTSVTHDTFNYQDLSNVYVMYGSTKLATKATVGASNNTWSISQTLAKNSTVEVDVYADIGSAITSGDSMKTTMTVSGITVSSGTSTNTDAVDGQTIAAATGTISEAVDASSPVASIVAGNQTKTAAAFKFTATNDNYTITDLTFTLAGATTVNSVNLMDGSTVVATKGGAATVTFSGLNIAVPSNGSKVLSVQLGLGTVGAGTGTSGEDTKVTLTGAKYTSSTGVTDHSSLNKAASSMYVFKSVPTITNVALPTTVLSAGVQTLAKFQVSSGGTGTISWGEIDFTVNASTGVTVDTPTLWDADAGTQVANVTCSGTTAVVCTSITDQEISGAKNYILKMNVGGTIASGAYVSTNIANPSSHVVPATFADASGANGGGNSVAASFVWSDESATGHSLTTTDWNNDYLVKNLPTDSQTLTK